MFTTVIIPFIKDHHYACVNHITSFEFFEWCTNIYIYHIALRIPLNTIKLNHNHKIAGDKIYIIKK
jgi:hypothetical protein